MMKLTLIIDTSIRGAAVGILRPGDTELIFSEVSEDIKDSARQLPLMVRRGLEGLGASNRDVGRLVVSQGPGSFTGIRVGLAYAYGFALGLHDSEQVLVLGASSLRLLAEDCARREQMDVALFLPATKTSGYSAIVRSGVSQMLPVDLSSTSFSGGFAGGLPKNWILVGEWPQLKAAADLCGSRILKTIDAEMSCEMALKALADKVLRGNELNWSTEMPEAIYLRKSSVEEKFDLENSEHQHKSVREV